MVVVFPKYCRTTIPWKAGKLSPVVDYDLVIFTLALGMKYAVIVFYFLTQSTLVQSTIGPWEFTIKQCSLLVPEV